MRLLSELITDLQRELDAHGDMPVTITSPTDEDGTSFVYLPAAVAPGPGCVNIGTVDHPDDPVDPWAHRTFRS